MQKIPDFLENKLKKDYSQEDIKKIKNGYLKKRYVSLRINTLKTTIDEVLNSLQDLNFEYELVNWFDNALILKNVNEFQIMQTYLYKDGLIYLQSLSSMIPPLVMELQNGEQVLDMAAAPGSKTSEMAMLLKNEILITAVEKDKIRCERLKYNLNKLGVKKVNVLNIDALNLDDYFVFDKILLDAPCSGSGILNMDNFNKNFTEVLVEKMKKRQSLLLKKAIKMLKKDGILVYSTCSILKEENDEIIKKVLADGECEIVPIEDFKNFDLPLLPTSIKGTLCFCPNELYEGFYVAKLKKVI